MISLILLVACSSAIVTAAAATPDNTTLVRMHGGDFNVTPHPFTDTGIIRDSAVTPTPVTLFRAELNRTELPGPRYMAFGPGVIAVSIDPRLLAVIFAATLAALVIWLLVVRKKSSGENGKDD